MTHKKTIAIIGATSEIGSAIAQSLAAGYHLLLMDAWEQNLLKLQTAIGVYNMEATSDILLCSKEASWEADIIILAISSEQVHPIAAKIKEVTTCKPVVQFISDDTDATRLQQLLPHASVVNVLYSFLTSAMENVDQAKITGNNQEAIEIARHILMTMAAKQMGDKSAEAIR